MRIIIAVFVIGLTWVAPPAVEAQSNVVFSTIDLPSPRLRLPAPASHDASVVRRRLVTIDLERLQRARTAVAAQPRARVRKRAVFPSGGGRDAVLASNATLTLNLFEDVVVTGIVERTEPTYSGGYSVSGRLVGNSLGTLTIVVNGETVAGTVRTLGGTYRIRSVGGGRYTISEVKEPPLDCQVLKPEAEGGRPKPPSR